MLRPRRYPLVVRLARIDRELSDAAQLVTWLMDDVRGARHALTEAEDRVTIVLAVTGALAMAGGAEGQMVGDWIMSLTKDFDREEADALGTEIVEQIMLSAADPEGEA